MGLPKQAAYCGGGLPLLAGGGLAGGGLPFAGGGLAGAAPWSAGGVVELGLAIEPDELSDGAAGALLCAGGAAAGSVLEDGDFAHAVSSMAAASALRATLVFIDRYPDSL